VEVAEDSSPVEEAVAPVTEKVFRETEEIARTTSWTFGNTSKAEFDWGSYLNTFHGGNSIALGAGQVTGNYTSQIYSTGGSNADAKSISWSPLGPYGKALPNDSKNNEESNRYHAGGVDMSDVVLLYHMDGIEGGSVIDGTTITDSSGQGRAGLNKVAEKSRAVYTAGKFNQATHFQSDDYLSIPSSRTDPAFDYGKGEFSWSSWVKLSGCVDASEDSTRVIMGAQRGTLEGAESIFPQIWLGARCNGLCGNNLMVSLIDSEGNGQAVCSTVDPADGDWHHVAFSKTGHNPGRAYLYVDGQKFMAGDVGWDGHFNFASDVDGAATITIDNMREGGMEVVPDNKVLDGEFRVGSFLIDPENQFLTEIEVDEIAIWKRGLSTVEMKALYYRGVKRLKAQVRGCVSSDCSTGQFVGPDGTANSFFSEANNSSAEMPSPQTMPANLNGKYFQYKLFFETAPGLSSPGLSEATIEVGL
ncbi:MAG: hypothetical protein HOM21_15135, partial [Halobacteriovoraceae bacterium]|nr:hypothetical protein [Halobacteriovoraceae bacterium]